MRPSIYLLPFAFLCACSSNDNGGGGSDMAAPSGGQDLAMSAASCDVLKQDCASGQKCVPKVMGAAQMVVGTQCMPNGSIAEGQPCQMDSSNAAVLNDNCAPGLLCDNTGGASTTICRKYCSPTTMCGTGLACAAVYTNTWGLCVPNCVPFGSGADCPHGSDCSVTFDAVLATSGGGVFVCKVTGTAAAFASCTMDSDCGANLGCDTTANWCVPICDNTHMCAQPPGADAGMLSCQSYTNYTSGAGPCG
jgi:hypothetical protein